MFLRSPSSFRRSYAITSSRRAPYGTGSATCRRNRGSPQRDHIHPTRGDIDPRRDNQPDLLRSAPPDLLRHFPHLPATGVRKTSAYTSHHEHKAVLHPHLSGSQPTEIAAWVGTSQHEGPRRHRTGRTNGKGPKGDITSSVSISTLQQPCSRASERQQKEDTLPTLTGSALRVSEHPAPAAVSRGLRS